MSLMDGPNAATRDWLLREGLLRTAGPWEEAASEEEGE